MHTNYTDNPNGATCISTLYNWSIHDANEYVPQTHTCGGGGYSKINENWSRMTWNGEKIPYNNQREWFETRGCVLVEAL